MSASQPILLESNEPDGEPGSDPVRALVLPLWRSRWFVGITLAVGGAAGLFFGLMQPNTYRSLGKLFLRPGAREATTTESLLDVQHGSGGGAQDYMPTELAMLQVDEVYQRVAREVSPRVLFSPYDPASTDGRDTPSYMRLFHKAQAWWFGRGGGGSSDEVGHPLDDCPSCIKLAAEALQKGLRIEREPYTQIIDVSYASHDPYLAKRVVDAFLTVAVERHQEFYDTSERLEVITAELEKARKEMDDTAGQLQEFRDDCGFNDPTAQLPALQTQRDTLNARLLQERSHLEALRAKSVETARKKAETPPTIEQDVLAPPQPNPDRVAFKAQEYKLREQIADLDYQSGMTTEERKNEEARLQKHLEIVLDQLEDMPVFLESPTPARQVVANPIYEDYRKQLDSIDLEMTALESSLPIDTQALDDLDERIEKASSCKLGYQDVADVASKARTNYQALLRSKERAESMNSLKDSNLQTIHDGTLPRDKEGPKRAKLLLVGLILGGMAGAALAFLRHLTDSTLRSPFDVERMLGMRVVGVLPRRSPPRSVRRAMRRAAM